MAFESDNEISYFAGPIYIKLSIPYNTITIVNTSDFNFKVSDLLDELKNAWAFNDSDIIESNDNIVKIKYNFNILNNYLAYSIIFINV